MSKSQEEDFVELLRRIAEAGAAMNENGANSIRVEDAKIASWLLNDAAKTPIALHSDDVEERSRKVNEQEKQELSFDLSNEADEEEVPRATHFRASDWLRKIAQMRDEGGVTALMLACDKGLPLTIKALLNSGGSDCFVTEQRTGNSASHFASHSGCVECLRALLDARRWRSYDTGDGGCSNNATAMEARKEPTRDEVKVPPLIMFGPTNNHLDTPLMMAVAMRHREAAEFMLKTLMDTVERARLQRFLESKNGSGMSVVSLALANSDSALLRLLLGEPYRASPFGLETGVETADDGLDCDSFDEVELMSMAADLAGQQYAEQLWSPSLQALINKARHSACHRHSPNKKHHDDANKKKQEKKQKQHLRQHGNVLNDEDKDQNDIHGSNHCLHCSDEGERDAKRECRLLLAVARALRNDEAVRSAEALIKEEADSKKKNTSRKSAGEARRQKKGTGKERRIRQGGARRSSVKVRVDQEFDAKEEEEEEEEEESVALSGSSAEENFEKVSCDSRYPSNSQASERVGATKPSQGSESTAPPPPRVPEKPTSQKHKEPGTDAVHQTAGGRTTINTKAREPTVPSARPSVRTFASVLDVPGKDEREDSSSSRPQSCEDSRTVSHVGEGPKVRAVVADANQKAEDDTHAAWWWPLADASLALPSPLWILSPPRPPQKASHGGRPPEASATVRNSEPKHHRIGAEAEDHRPTFSSSKQNESNFIGAAGTMANVAGESRCGGGGCGGATVEELTEQLSASQLEALAVVLAARLEAVQEARRQQARQRGLLEGQAAAAAHLGRMHLHEQLQQKQQQRS